MEKEGAEITMQQKTSREAPSEEQGDRFHQDMKQMEMRYQGRWNVFMMADLLVIILLCDIEGVYLAVIIVILTIALIIGFTIGHYVADPAAAAMPSKSQAATEGADTGAPKTELEELQFKCREVADESLNSTRRMLTLCEEGKEAGIRILVDLDDQEEKLEAMEKGMDDINEDMIEAQKSLAAMGKCCGLCDLSCNKGSSNKEDEAVWKGGDEDSKVVSNQPQRVMDPNCMGPQTGYIGKITNDDQEKEMEENMEQVAAMVGNMRNMALDIGNSLQSQEALLNRITRKAEVNERNVAEAVEKAHALMKD
ncbi:Synaptosomal-associated protein 25 [Gryllus bimaculatus]|nr:Synaptosomal-associated protein 25 [Gryllus bimaculatus]